jgi:hypothetical protein
MLAVFGQRDVHVPAKNPIEMALIGKAAQKGDLFERQPIFTQMLARTLHLAAQDIGLMYMEFARELNRRAVADVGQLIMREPSDSSVGCGFGLTRREIFIIDLLPRVLQAYGDPARL